MSSTEEKQRAARDVVTILQEISTILNTDLNRATLSVCISMIENGVNPEALAAVVKDLRRDAESHEMDRHRTNRRRDG